MDLERTQTVLSIAALIPAAAMAARSPKHRPIAALVALFVLEHPALSALRERVVLPAQKATQSAGGDPFAVPLTGLVRVALHVYQAIYMAWAPAVAAVAAIVFGRRYAWRLPAVLWAGASVLVAVCYENLRGERAASVYLLVELVAIALAFASLVGWAKLRRSVESQHAAVVVCVVVEVVGLLVYRLGPWGGLWERGAWDFARAANVLTFGALLLIEGASLWNTRSESLR